MTVGGKLIVDDSLLIPPKHSKTFLTVNPCLATVFRRLSATRWRKFCPWSFTCVTLLDMVWFQTLFCVIFSSRPSRVLCIIKIKITLNRSDETKFRGVRIINANQVFKQTIWEVCSMESSHTSPDIRKIMNYFLLELFFYSFWSSWEY